jgi:thiol-disulfide isomerase/thioredoxin
LSLPELKGKIVLIDFSYVGCLPCMQAIKPMNDLHEKYKNKEVAIVSIYPIDKSASVANYVKKYGIKYPVYIGANSLCENIRSQVIPVFILLIKTEKLQMYLRGIQTILKQKHLQ